jgi:hypothetical protein
MSAERGYYFRAQIADYRLAPFPGTFIPERRTVAATRSREAAVAAAQRARPASPLGLVYISLHPLPSRFHSEPRPCATLP